MPSTVQNLKHFYLITHYTELMVGMILTKRTSTQRKPCLIATLSTTYLTCTDLVSHPGLPSNMSPTNYLSHGSCPCMQVMSYSTFSSFLKHSELY